MTSNPVQLNNGWILWREGIRRKKHQAWVFMRGGLYREQSQPVMQIHQFPFIPFTREPAVTMETTGGCWLYEAWPVCKETNHTGSKQKCFWVIQEDDSVSSKAINIIISNTCICKVHERYLCTRILRKHVYIANPSSKCKTVYVKQTINDKALASQGIE